jgi:protein TonB
MQNSRQTIAARIKKLNRRFEFGLIVALGLISIAFYGTPHFHYNDHLIPQTKIDVAEPEIIPLAKAKKKLKPPPKRPHIPVAAPDAGDEFADIVDEEITEIKTARNGQQVPLYLPTDSTEAAPFLPYQLEFAPKAIHQVLPEYPSLAKKTGTEGMVQIEIIVGLDGKVEKAEVVKGHVIFNHPAMEAVKQWRFTPGRQGDRPVRVRMVIPFSFRVK